MWRKWVGGMVAAGLAGCSAPPPPAIGLPPREAAQNFVAVVDQIEPMIESTCRAVNPARTCDFQIVIDMDPMRPPNAFQTQMPDGRPLIVFTLSLIAMAQNRDELAFILGHEAGHHILGHLAQTEQQAAAGAVLAGVLASAGGLNPADIDKMVRLGGDVAARSYAKDFEFQADLVGTDIAFAAGYDPILGAAFFDRLPDPGDRFLGSHPGNADRKALVAWETARLRGM